VSGLKVGKDEPIVDGGKRVSDDILPVETELALGISEADAACVLIYDRARSPEAAAVMINRYLKNRIRHSIC
jgi:hypothetical protein